MSQTEHSLTWKNEPKLVSRWAEGLSLETPLPEYPRPQLVREDWLNLNGEWEFLGEGPEPPELPTEFAEKALVPSPTQAVTSCLEKEWTHGWYRKSIEIPAAWTGKNVLVNFEGVGGITTVYCNGQELGSNTGAWNRFSLQLPAEAGTSCELIVRFDDREPRLPRGKPDKFSGIWQTVWLEPVPEVYIRGFRQTPDIDTGHLGLRCQVSGVREGLTLSVAAYDGEMEVGQIEASAGDALTLQVPDPKLWSPEHPFLYDLTLELKKGDKVIDRVTSYFGMRKIECGEVDGKPRMLLNNEVYYQVGLLDHGQWPESHFTPPSDESLKWEIEMAKAMGFNVNRKHLKVEASRWYYWCDVLGMLVWQDLPRQNHFLGQAHSTEEDKDFARNALRGMIEQFYNHPSVICWVIFNEANSQFEPREMTILTRNLDQSRMIDTTSHVWPNAFNRKQYITDFYDFHCYSRTLHFGDTYDAPLMAHVPVALGEFGGIGYLFPENTEKHETYVSYLTDATSEEELLCYYKALIFQARQMRETHDLCAIIYTMITDRISEINGWITYDRKVTKVDINELRKINQLFTKGERT